MKEKKQIDPDHLAVLVHKRARKYGNKTAIQYRDFSEKKWKNLSWKKYSEIVEKTSWAMAELGVLEEDRVGIYSQNMLQYFFVEFGVYANRAINTPIYATSSPSQVEYIVNDSQLKLLFVGEQFQYNNAYKVQEESSTLKNIIIFDKNVKLHSEDKTSIYFEDFIASGDNSEAKVLVNVRTKSRKEEDIACIIYTSGTTGEPKGVVLTHESFIEVLRIHDIRLSKVSDKDTSMNFLPLAHIFEKAWSYYCFHKGVKIIINQDAKSIQKSIKQMKPTLMCNVPRFWEKVYAGVKDKIDNSGPVMSWLYKDAIKTGRRYKLDYKNNGQKISLGSRIKYHFYNLTVYNILKMVIGIHKGRLFPCAGAPLSDTICEFLISVNIPITVGYGLTETNATVSFFPDTNYVIGSVGVLMPDVEVKIDPKNDEILIKGKTLLKEYYNKPEANKEAFTEDGFFRTGDAGRMEDGVLYLTERIKDLYKTANGKYIAPQAIETKIGADPLIEMVIAIADERKFVSALIVPNYELLADYAKKNKIEYSDPKELVKNKTVLRMLDSKIEILQADLAPYEKIKKYRLLQDPFTMEGGELTNTLKMKRRFIADKYKEVIDTMYVE